MKGTKLYVFVLIGLLGFPALSAELNSSANSQQRLHDVQQRWAKVNYQLEDEVQEQEFEALVADAQQWVEKEPESAPAHIWLGIIKSTYAGVKGGLGALSLAKESKKSLEKALELDPNALDGSAYASLGTLYYKVPGWPFGFGDDDKAQQLLEKALTINPDGIDPNYFYADYWFEQGDYTKAEHYAQKALKAAPRPERPLADESRRAEVNQLLAKIQREQ
ncbi:MAG: tetratricopeptide repeat protein [Pseudomonadota bacterium]